MPIFANFCTVAMSEHISEMQATASVAEETNNMLSVLCVDPGGSARGPFAELQSWEGCCRIFDHGREFIFERQTIARPHVRPSGGIGDGNCLITI